VGGRGNIRANGAGAQVSIRAFFPVWVFLYVIQFVLMPVIARDAYVSVFFGNSLYLLAFGYYVVITFLGYNGVFCRKSMSNIMPSAADRPALALPFLHHTELLLSPILVFLILWIVTLVADYDLPKHLAPVLWAGARLRHSV
jgi:hypothetical protein